MVDMVTIDATGREYSGPVVDANPLGNVTVSSESGAITLARAMASSYGLASYWPTGTGSYAVREVKPVAPAITVRITLSANDFRNGWNGDSSELLASIFATLYELIGDDGGAYIPTVEATF